jgi:hypothetical protein
MRAAWAVRGLLCLAIALGIAHATFVALRSPLWGVDYGTTWGLKARAFAQTGELSSVMRVDPEGLLSHPEYPVLWPLLLAAAGSTPEGFDDLRATLLWPLLLLAATGAAAAAVRGSVELRLLAAAFVALLPAWRVPIYPGYAEGLLLALLLGSLALSRLAPPWALWAPGLLAAAVFTKNEGLLLAIAACVAAALLRRRGTIVAVLAALLVGAVPWRLFVASEFHGGARDFSLSAFAVSKATAAAAAFAGEAGLGGFVWLGLCLVLLGLAPETRRSRAFELVTLAVYSLGLLASFAFSRLDTYVHVHYSWDRLVFVIAGLLAPILAEAVGECLRPQTRDLASPMGQATPVPPMPQ